jgi:NAD(P)H-hydrate epimerase
MKILAAAETREADAYTIKNEPIASIDLMERASQAFVNFFIEHFHSKRTIHIFCGTGNNGGDGLAVARILLHKKYNIQVYLVNFKDKGSPDFMTNLERLKKIHEPELITDKGKFPAFTEDDVVIDAIFGSGLTRPVEGIFAQIISEINEKAKHIVSIDIASGLFADTPSQKGAIVTPSLTITFQTPKLAFLIPENEKYVGVWVAVNIGLNREFIENTPSSNYMLTSRMVKKMIRERRKFSHKGDFGKAIILSGSMGKMGAAVLAARACMRTGAGLLTMQIPQCGYNIIQTAVPEAMVTVDSQKDYLTQFPDLTPYSVVGMGPGIGTHPETTRMLYKLLENHTNPMAIDADAINIIGKNRFLLEKLPVGSILTPHLKEFERITEPCNNHFDRLEMQRDFSKKYKVVVILKGANSSISLPDGRILFNTTGNPGMATGGSGDVLTGMITGLLAQNYRPSEAAILGTYLHGLAGDLAEEKLGREGMIASDILEEIPQAFLHVKK